MEKKGKNVTLRVLFLDDKIQAFQIHVKAYGSVLWEAVVRHLNLMEADYFDLEYKDSKGLKTWLDREKAIMKQLPFADVEIQFLVKFYTPDPALLEDELTRYMFALQIKRDLAMGSLTCSDNTMALLASYIAQAELGDFPMEEYADHTYLRANDLKYLPNQSEDMERKIMEYHKQHVGETPGEADINLLDTARKVELYGIRMVPAKDHESVSLNLAVSHSGILVFQHLTKINTFSWAKIRKLSFKRKRLLIKLHPENYGYYKDLVEFFFDSRDECKGFWKKCIEHHAFYRCHKVKKIPRHKTRVVSRGSSFRYSGRTQKELQEFIRDNFNGRRPAFERTVSGRISSRSSSVTPKIPTKAHHNSADLHNSTASSGSHTFEQSHAPPVYSNDMQDRMDAHSESSVSGSRSLNSPKLDRGQSQDVEGSSQVQEAAMLVSEGVEEGEATVVTVVTKEENHEDEQGALSDKFTNMLNINTNLDEVEVNEHYLDVVDNSIILTHMSANQNVNDNDDSQSRASAQLTSGDTELEPTNSISLPSELKSASIDQSDSLSLYSDSKDLGFDQSDLSSQSGLSAEEIADLESCLQTISNIGCGELNSLVENVVELLPSVARPVTNHVEPLDADTVALPPEDSENSINEEALLEECLNHMMKTDDEMISSVIEKSGNYRLSETALEKLELTVSDYNHVDQDVLVSDKLDSAYKRANVEPSSCILSKVESSKQNDKSWLRNEILLKNLSDSNVNELDIRYELDFDINDDAKSGSDISDMLDDIPYYLHRRHIEGDEARMKETELYTALVNALNSAVSPDLGTNRRCRSLRRPPNMQIQQLKADEIPFQPRSSSTPGTKRAPSKSPVRRSVRSERASTEPRRSRKSTGSSHSRSPSGGRRIELVNFHKLPKKDNFSYVDDTASPPKDQDVVAHFMKYRDTSSEFDERSFDENSVSFEKSPITESDAEGNLSSAQLISESDSFRALSEGSMSLTQSSVSINESETSQGSYSLSDLNLSRDEVYEMGLDKDSLDGSRKETISLDDLDLPYIDSFDETDITSSEMCHLGSSTPQQHLVEKKHEPIINTVELTTSESHQDHEAESDRSINVPVNKLNESQDKYKSIESQEKYKSNESQEKFQVPVHDILLDTKSELYITESDDEPAPLKYEETHFDAEDIVIDKKDGEFDNEYSKQRSQATNSKTVSKPHLKPLDIPVKTERHKSSKEAEWEALMKELKEADERSPDDLHPSDLLLSLSAERSRSDAKRVFRKKSSGEEETSIDELDELLLQTTAFNNNDPEKSFQDFDLAASILLSNTHRGTYAGQNRQNLQFSTFKPADSPTEYQGNPSDAVARDYRGVVTVTLSHDIEDIQMEEKSISDMFDQPVASEAEHQRGRTLTPSQHHATIKRSISPRRLVEYSTSSVKHVEIKGESETDTTKHPKRHSYHGERSQDLETVQTRRKRMEPKRVSFHETVEEITTEAYQSSSSSGEDRQSGSESGNMSDLTSPSDMPTSSSAASDLCYSPDSREGTQSRGGLFLQESDTVINTGNLSYIENVYSNGETSGTESDDESSSDEAERDRVDEFLKFAQSLADSGKDYATDSGVGDSIANTTEVSPCDPLQRNENIHDCDENEEDIADENDKTVLNTIVNSTDIHVPNTQTFTESSSSSSSSEDVADVNKKRPSIDPLESLEQFHDSYVSSDESFEGNANNILDMPEPVAMPHGFRPNDRKVSAPVIGYRMNEELTIPENHLSRTDEIENIPNLVTEKEQQEEVHFTAQTQGLTNGHNSHTSPNLGDYNADMSDISLPVVDEQEESTLEMSGDVYPPPPPPPLSHDLSFTLGSEQSTPRKDHRSAASGLNSNISTLSETRTEVSEDGDKRKNKRYPVDKAYYIAKELLMTERTYKKDLEVITVWFKNMVSGEDTLPDYLMDIFKYIDPIYAFHCGFLKELEQRLSMWEGKSNAHLNGDYQKIGDLMVNSFLTSLGPYMNYLEKQDDILMDLEKAQKSDKEFEFVYKDFESQKVCYLPLNTFLLKPGQRLLHYKLLLERLTVHYAKSHPDYMDCKVVMDDARRCMKSTLTKLSELTETFRSQRKVMENLQKLMELQRDLVGLENLVHPDREFVREGCLQKFSRKGYQQRMFFLFSDMLVYTSRTATPMLQFKVHGQVPLRGMIIEESDHAKMAVANSFAIYGGNKCILVAASTQEEKDKWIEDLNESVMQAKNRNEDKLKYASLKSSTSSNENVQNVGEQNPPSPDKQIQHRANTTMHVCWHRNTSVSKRDHEKAIKNQLSGYLLRKFKNSNGWQKLWVVFTNFCLYFYKTYQDDYPLASLPLLGYAVSQPEEGDNIHKEYVFKLQFKNHVYFFRAESEYTYERWMEVINSATSSARRIRLFSRMDSSQP